MPLRKHKPNRFNWQHGCRFTLLTDGKEFYPAMLEAIDRAEKFILLEQYLVESGHITHRFVEALIRARQRGVTVWVMLDAYGSRLLEVLDRQRLVSQDIKLVFFNPISYRRFYRSLRRDHRKLLLVDAKVAFTGGAGLHDAFDPPFNPDQAWHEAMVRIEGPVLRDWQQAFVETWKKLTGEVPELPAVPQISYSSDHAGRVALSAGLNLQEIKRGFINHVRQAQQQVWLATPYFVPSRKIRQALRRQARAGVDVRLLLPGPVSDHPWVSHAARGFYHRLLRNGVRIFEYQPRFIHAKIGLCDNWCTLGSSNLDRWNQRWNLDANQEVEDRFFQNQVAQLFELAFTQSQEIRLSEWECRSHGQRLREWLSARLVALLESLGRRYSK